MNQLARTNLPKIMEIKDNESTGLSTSYSSDKIIISTKDYQLVNPSSKSKVNLSEATAPKSERHQESTMVEESSLDGQLSEEITIEMTTAKASAPISDIDSDLHESCLKPRIAVAHLNSDNLHKLDNYLRNKA